MSESDAMNETGADPGNPETEESAEAPAKELTPEEQMAAYEEALKETDWGHQPC